ncbi:MAG TPA: NADH-quinone oxidoreductase subunit C [Acidobacteriota bacterium]|nr:NADH-quinone oxidoreductase subunit C [Acidobacteriota bacterium]
MKPEEISALLAEKFGGRVLESKLGVVSPWSVIESGAILEVCRFLRSDERLLMDHLELLGGVDYKDRIEVVYVVYSMAHHHRYTVKVRLPRENPSVDTVESVWGIANWHEREAFDMFGVVFNGHSDMRRILCPDDWEGYPLRKDYKFPTSYRDMPV